MEFRDMTAGDVPACATLYVRAFNVPPWNDNWDAQSAADRLERLVAKDGFFGLCAFPAVGNRMSEPAHHSPAGPSVNAVGGFAHPTGCVAFAAGYVEAWHTASNYYLKEMCVDPALHRRGIGTAVVRELLSRLAGRGVASVRLGTRRGSPAEAFYRKMGFAASDWLIQMNRPVAAADVGGGA